MQRRKHIQLDWRESFTPCRAKDYCGKMHRYRKKESNNERNRAREQGQEEVQKQHIKKKAAIVYIFLCTFYSLTLHMIYFTVKNLMGEKINH